MMEKKSDEVAHQQDLEINIFALLKTLARRKFALAVVGLAGAAVGYGICSLLPKKYQAAVHFDFQTQSAVPGRLQQLAALTGNLNMNPGGSPYITHLKTFAQTREVTARLRSLRYHDSTLYDILTVPAKTDSGSVRDNAFHGAATSHYKVIKGEDGYRLTAKAGDAEFARFLAHAIFESMGAILEEKRRERIKKKLDFLDTLVTSFYLQYETTSNRKRQFQMNNRDISSPNLTQAMEQIFLQLKLDEEKYLIAVKEQEELKIQFQQSEEPLVVLEDAYNPGGHYFPSRPKFMSIATLGALILFVLGIAFFERKRWIFLR